MTNLKHPTGQCGYMAKRRNAGYCRRPYGRSIRSRHPWYSAPRRAESQCRREKPSLCYTRALFVGLVVGACAFVLAQQATAATIIVNAPDIYGRTFVDVVGDLAAGDDKAFMDKVGTPAEPEKVIVTLMSNGGQYFSAFGIGEVIRLTGMATYVPAARRVQVPVHSCGLPALSDGWAPTRISASTVFMMRQPDNNRCCLMSC